MRTVAALENAPTVRANALKNNGATAADGVDANPRAQICAGTNADRGLRPCLRAEAMFDRKHGPQEWPTEVDCWESGS